MSQPVSPSVFEVLGMYGARFQVKQEIGLLQDMLRILDEFDKERRAIVELTILEELPAILEKVQEVLG